MCFKKPGPLSMRINWSLVRSFWPGIHVVPLNASLATPSIAIVLISSDHPQLSIFTKPSDISFFFLDRCALPCHSPFLTSFRLSLTRLFTVSWLCFHSSQALFGLWYWPGCNLLDLVALSYHLSHDTTDSATLELCLVSQHAFENKNVKLSMIRLDHL